MGTNTLSVATDGQVIPAAHHNELVTAIGGDFVPRNASRVPQDIIGQLGTSALRWLRTYSNEYYIGAAAQNLKIYEGASGEIWIERNASNKELIKLKNGSIELVVNNVTVATFSQTTLTTVDKYILHSNLQTNPRFKSATFDYGATGSSYDEIWTTTLTNCTAGKKIHIDVSGLYTAEVGDNIYIRFLRNGVEIQEYPNILSADGATEFHRQVLTYTVPTDGTYIISMEMADADGVINAAYVVQEI